MNEKQQIVTALREEYRRWEELLAGMTEEQIVTPYAPHKEYNLSVKDVIAHLRAWQQRSVARLEAGLLNREPQFPRWPADLDPESEGATDKINTWIYETSRDKSWPEIHEEWSAGFQRLLELAEATPESDLLNSAKYPWQGNYTLAFILTASLEHHREHFEKFQDGV